MVTRFRTIFFSSLAVLALLATTAMPSFAAQAPITTTITDLNVQAGDNFLPASGVVIPAGYTTLTVQLDFSNWQSTDNIFVFASFSTDNGTTWADGGGIETNGGTHLCKDQVTVCFPGFITGVPAGTNVMVRAHYIVPSRAKVSGSMVLS